MANDDELRERRIERKARKGPTNSELYDFAHATGNGEFLLDYLEWSQRNTLERKIRGQDTRAWKAEFSHFCETLKRERAGAVPKGEQSPKDIYNQRKEQSERLKALRAERKARSERRKADKARRKAERERKEEIARIEFLTQPPKWAKEIEIMTTENETKQTGTTESPDVNILGVEYYSQKLVSQMFQVSRQTIGRMIRRGELTGTKKGREWIIKPESIREYLQEKTSIGIAKLGTNRKKKGT